MESSANAETNENPTTNDPDGTSATPTNNELELQRSVHGHGKSDLAWAYFSLKKEGKTSIYTCLFCYSVYKEGGINRMKQHLAGIIGQVAQCKKVPFEVRAKMKESLKEGAKKKAAKNVEEQLEDIESNNKPIDLTAPEISASKKRVHGTVESYFPPKTTPGSQPSLKSVLSSKEAQHKAKMVIAECALSNCIPFSTFDCPLFQKAINAIASIGPGFKGPNAYDFRVNLLRDWKRECELLIESHRAKWSERGCTLMADGWTDVRNRTLINFLVYSTHGMVFVKSIDASDIIKDAKTLFILFCEVIEWIDPKNVVHVVTDNASNYVACGKLIKQKYKTIYWSPCAAHCLNFLLKDIASMPHVSDLATKVSKIIIFAYNHMIFLSWLRKREGWKEIVRPGATRFATTFIILHSICMHKHHLQALVVDKHFIEHKLAGSEAGMLFSSIILDSKFWGDCFQIVKIASPIMKLLRLVDSDEKPSLPYVYEGMQRAKNAIKGMFQNIEDQYKPYTNLIQSRWDKHLKGNLHASAYLLNPAFFHSPGFVHKQRVIQALIDVFEAYSGPSYDYVTMMQQVCAYRDRKQSFDKDSCKIAAQRLDPCEWWMFYGDSVSELQKIAMRILSQTSSSSGCKRNWSLFECIHTKRRNRLEHERLNDLVYTNYNLRLKNRSLMKKKPDYDSIDYEAIDKVDFWVVDDSQDSTPEFNDIDVTNLESAVANERGDEGDGDMDILEPPSLNDEHGASAFGFPPPTSTSKPIDLNEVNHNFEGYDY